VQKYDPDGARRLVLMEDGAPVHTAKISADFLAASNITKIPNWPPQSPDLNPIEHVWKALKSHVQELYHPSSVAEMQHALKLAWLNFPNHFLVDIIKSMPDRFQAVIDAHGGPTDW
jgi:transposase